MHLSGTRRRETKKTRLFVVGSWELFVDGGSTKSKRGFESPGPTVFNGEKNATCVTRALFHNTLLLEQCMYHTFVLFNGVECALFYYHGLP